MRKCDYFKDGTFDFLKVKGPCWGDDFKVREAGEGYEEMFCCEAHLLYYFRGKYTKCPTQLEVKHE